MSVVTALRNLAYTGQLGRQIGRTYSLANAAKRIGATFVCYNVSHEHFIKREHKVPTTISYKEIRGTTGPYIYDHFTLEMIAHDAIREIERLEAELDKANEKLNRIASIAMSVSK